MEESVAVIVRVSGDHAEVVRLGGEGYLPRFGDIREGIRVGTARVDTRWERPYDDREKLGARDGIIRSERAVGVSVDDMVRGEERDSTARERACHVGEGGLIGGEREIYLSCISVESRAGHEGRTDRYFFDGLIGGDLEDGCGEIRSTCVIVSWGWTGR